MKLFNNYLQSPASIGERLEEILGADESMQDPSPGLPGLLGVLDMTTLEGSDNEARVKSLCLQSRFSLIGQDLPDAAAVCVYPSLVHIASRELRGTGVGVASAAGAFPSGQTSLKVKLEEIIFAIGEGAGEIDTVISRGKLLEGRDEEVLEELRAIREVCGDKRLKIILETGELGSVGMIRKASELAILAGADFLKTSTGKIAAGATPEAFLVMADTIREYLEKTGKAVGLKAAGGIRAPEQALAYARIAMSVLGESYLHKQFFRIGASSLAGELLKSILASDLPYPK